MDKSTVLVRMDEYESRLIPPYMGVSFLAYPIYVNGDKAVENVEK